MGLISSEFSFVLTLQQLNQLFFVSFFKHVFKWVYTNENLEECLFLGHMLLLLLLPIFTCGLCVTGWQKSAVMSLRLGCNESKSKSLVKNVNRFSFFYVWPVDFGYSNSKHKFRELIFLDLFIFHIFFYKVSKLALKSSLGSPYS